VDGVDKHKISEALGLNKLGGRKHNAGDVGKEQAARKGGHTVKSGRETAQHTASGTLMLTSHCFLFVC
jgi:hypothetical protein